MIGQIGISRCRVRLSSDISVRVLRQTVSETTLPRSAFSTFTGNIVMSKLCEYFDRNTSIYVYSSARQHWPLRFREGDKNIAYYNTIFKGWNDIVIQYLHRRFGMAMRSAWYSGVDTLPVYRTVLCDTYGF